MIDGASPLRMYVRILDSSDLADRRLSSRHPAATRAQDLRSRASPMTAGGPASRHAADECRLDYMFQRGRWEGSAAAVMLLMVASDRHLPYVVLQQIRRRGQHPMVESRFHRTGGGRFALYAVLVAFAPFYLTPLVVVFLNSCPQP